MSRQHVEVRISDGALYIRDLGTTNGSLINTTVLAPKKWYPLQENYTLKLGKGDEINITMKVVDNVIDFPQDEITPVAEPSPVKYSTSQKPQVDEPTQAVVVSGNTAIKQQVYTSPTPASMQADNLDHEINSIAEISDKLEAPNLSEVEMLKIKKLEIDAKVAAIQIKKDAEEEVARLKQDTQFELEQQRADVQRDLKEQNEKIQELKDFVETLEGKIQLLNDEYDQAQANVNIEQKKKQDILDEIEYEKSKLSDLKDEIAEQIERNSLKIDNLAMDYEAEKDRFRLLQEDLESEFKQLELERLSDAEKLELQIKDLELISSELDFSNKEKEHQLIDLNDQIQKYKKECDNSKEDYDRIQQRLDKLYQEKDEKQDLLKQLANDIEILRTEINNSDRKQVELNNSILDKEDRLRKITSELDSQMAEGKAAVDREINAQRLKEQAKLDREMSDARDEILAEKELAQKEAEDIRSLAKSRSDEITKQAEALLEQTKINSEKSEKEISQRVELAIAEYEKTLMSAKEKQDSIIEEANNKATSLLQEAQGRSNEIIEVAQEKTVQLHQSSLKELEEARKDLDQKVTESKTNLENLEKEIKSNESKLDDLKNTLEQEREAALSDIEKNRVEVEEKANAEANKIIQQANSDYAARIEECSKEQQEIIEQTKVELERQNKIETIKLETIKKEELDSLNQLKAAAMEQIRNDKVNAQAELENWKKVSMAQIANSIESIVNARLSQVAKEKLSGKEIGLEAKEIRSLVEKSMSGSSKAQSAVFGLLSGGGSSQGKSVRVMKKWAIIAGVIIFFSVIGLLKPEFYISISNSIVSIFEVEESAQQKYTKTLNEKRKNAPKFDPNLVLTMQATLAESVIYTEDFFEIWTSKEYIREWGVRVDNLIMYKMRLKTQDVNRFLAEEEKLIRKLNNMRKSITPKNFEKIKRDMIELDMKFEEQLITILKSGDNYETMLDAREDFYNKFAEKYHSKKSKK